MKLERRLINDTTISTELTGMMVVAQNMLCELETAINSTWHKMPEVFTRQAMNNKLTFRNHNSGSTTEDVDALDIRFTKVRFTEYIHSLISVMERPRRRLKKNKNFQLKSGPAKQKMAQRLALRKQRQRQQRRKKNQQKRLRKIQKLQKLKKM